VVPPGPPATTVRRLRTCAIPQSGMPNPVVVPRYGVLPAGRAGRSPRQGTLWLRPCRRLRPWRGRPRPRCRFSRRRRPDSVPSRRSGCRVPAGVVERRPRRRCGCPVMTAPVRLACSSATSALGWARGRARPESRIPGDRDRGPGVGYRTPIESSRRLADRVQAVGGGGGWRSTVRRSCHRVSGASMMSGPSITTCRKRLGVWPRPVIRS
jgi:hypothetical protein